jgi:hypothetical protein
MLLSQQEQKKQEQQTLSSESVTLLRAYLQGDCGW